MPRPKRKSKTQREKRHQAKTRQKAERRAWLDQVEIGMSQWEVRQYLGNPQSQTTMDGFLGQYGKSIRLGRGRDLLDQKEFWMYNDCPEPGKSTMVTFTAFHVSDIRTR